MSLSPPINNDSEVSHLLHSNSDDSSRAKTDDEKPLLMDINEIKYALNAFWATVKPVGLTLVLSSLAVVYIESPFSQTRQGGGLNVYDISDDDWYDESGDSNTEKLGKSMINALTIVGTMAALTFLIVFLYYIRCTRFLQAYMIFSSFTLLSFMGGIFFSTALQQFDIALDAFSFFFILYNFAIVGVISIFYQTGIPSQMTQGYLILTSVLLAWQLSKFDEYTCFALLVALAFYDLCAVLTPCGPLKALVGLMQERNEPLPGLLYEANIATGTPNRGDGNMSPARGSGATGGGNGGRRSSNSNKKSKSKNSGKDRDDDKGSSRSSYGDGDLELVTVVSSPSSLHRRDNNKDKRRELSDDKSAAATTTAAAAVAAEYKDYDYVDRDPRNMEEGGYTAATSHRSPPPNPKSPSKSSTTGAGTPNKHKLSSPSFGITDDERPRKPITGSEDGGGVFNPLSSSPRKVQGVIAADGTIKKSLASAAVATAVTAVLGEGVYRGGGGGGYEKVPTHTPLTTDKDPGTATSATLPSTMATAASTSSLSDHPYGSLELGGGRGGGPVSTSVSAATTGTVSGSSRSPQPAGAAVTATDAVQTAEPSTATTDSDDEADTVDANDTDGGTATVTEFRSSIKLGLGDFVFYSVLVSRASMHGFLPFVACSFVVIGGLGVTLLLLAVYKKALPALPISILLGVAAYFLTQLFLAPFMDDLSVYPIFI